MRRVDAEGDSQSRRGLKRDDARASRSSRSHLRRLALEGLEERALLSTLPSAVTQGQFIVGDSQSGLGNSSSPNVAIDPLNPNKLVAAWVVNDPGHLLDNAQVTTYVEGGYSVDGGQTWLPLPNTRAGGSDDGSGVIDADVQQNFSATGSPQPHFAQTTDATVAFGRDQSVYLLTSSHDAADANGVLDLQRWDFSSDTPSPQTIYSPPSYVSLPNVPATVNPIYRWQGYDPAITPTLAVDNNVANFDDGATTPNDPFSGNVYVAWETNDAPPANTSQNPNTIKLMVSSDQGTEFTYQAYLNNHATGNLYDQPKIAISQGSATVPAGQVTIVYDNANGNTAPFFDTIDTKDSTTGGNDYHFDSAIDTPVPSATPPVAPATNDNPVTTTIPITVNVPTGTLPDGSTFSVQDVTLSLSLQYPTLANTSAVLVAPDGTTVLLWNTATNSAGTATNAQGTIAGANMGAAVETIPGSNPTQPYFIGTVLDSDANRPLTSGTAPYTGHYQPANGAGPGLNVFKGFTAAQVNGTTNTWNLEITSFRTETPTSPPTPIQLIGASLDFTSGNSDITKNPQNFVEDSFLNSGAHQYTGSGIQTGSAAAILPAPSIASDNTLGANSPFQGRLYIAFTNDNYTAGNAYTNSTFIQLYYSDDGGQSWLPDTDDAITGFNDGIVNDDNGLKDGFSTGGFAFPNSGTAGDGLAFPSEYAEANVRPKLEPQVAVDPDTGTVVVTYLDTRNDAADLRVATYIAVSSDGGTSFAPETYANESNPFDTPNPAFGILAEAPFGIPTITTDAITGQPVNLGPVPDNESAGNAGSDGTFGFGQRQGLAVLDGHIIPVWSSNQNGTTVYAPTEETPTYVGAAFFTNEGSNARNQKPFLNIEAANVVFAAGPRVIASTEGPVGQPGDMVNIDTNPDGSIKADTIVITFDRAVDPASFPADGPGGLSPLAVFYNNPAGGAPVRLPVTSVAADPSDTVYTVRFTPPTADDGVGSYTYTLSPLVRGMIPYQTTITTNQVQQVPFIDTASGGQASFTVTGNPGIPLTTATLAAKVDVYQKGVSTGSPTDLEIFLVAQDGTRYLFFSSTTQGRPQGTAFNVNSSIAIPAGEPLDQTYTILLVDNVPNEQAFLFDDIDANDFDFQVTLNNQRLNTLTGNELDQNANGVPGEQPGDDYSVPTGRDSLPLIVPGPHVVSTTVTGVGGVVGTPPTPTSPADSVKLVDNDDVDSLSVTFDRTMLVSSFTPAQVLSVVGPTGSISGPQVFPSTGTSRTFSFEGPFELIPKAGTLTSLIPISGTGLDVSSLKVQVNITDPNDSSLQLILEAPDGTMVPLVNAGTAAGANFTGTTFSDAPSANGLTSTIPAGAAPYSLTYQPATPLAALAGKAIDGTWKLLVTDTTAAGAQGRLNSWSLAITPEVPKGPGTQLNSTLDITSFPDNSFTIAHLAVQLNISSTNDADLTIELVAPDGTTVIPLVNAGTTAGANFTNTTFDDAATLTIAQGAAPYGLTYRPASPLSAADGLSIEGTWTLRIISANNDTSVTTLNSWSLIATPQLTVTPVDPVGGGATTFMIGFPTQDLSGNYNITLSPNILSVAPNPANPSTGTPLDTNLNAGVDALRGTSTGVTTPVTYPATAVPVPIPYAKTTPLGTTDGVLTSQILVPDNFAIQGDNGALAGLTVSLNISYYNDPDLTATLTAPDGKTITLFMNVGKGPNPADFTGTTLSDTVTPLAPITTAAAPFFGTFNPQQPLADFATDPSGDQAFSQGLWTLTITNIGQDPGVNVDQKIPPTLLSWALNFQKPQVSTGLGEPVADQATVGFRLFNFAANNPLASDTWTAVGPAGTTSVGNTINGDPGGVNLAGPVSVVAIDPADPTSNTAYIGASSGGIWKTDDFLTTDPSGPTYLPLTDFGANYSINVGSIAIFDQNNDPNQSIIFAGTGDGAATTANAGNAVQGVGFLRSTNGGASFTLLDSSENVYPTTYPASGTYPNGTPVPANLVGTAVPANLVGTPLPENSPFRDHIFVGTTTYKVIVDPTAQPGVGPAAGRVIVYAALGGKNGGLWRSLDGGNTWTNLSAGVVPQVNGQNAAATDVLLDPASASNSTGNLEILYAGFAGVGVYISSSQGQALTELLGNVGADNLIQDSQTVPGTPLKVADANPNGNFGRIILAKPALTANASENILYQDWLYVAVENTNGTFNGLYVTKDRGENWTKAEIANLPTPGSAAVTQALPTNSNTEALNYDVTNPTGSNGGGGFSIQNGNSVFSMTIDPLNPNIVYLGGTQDYATSGLIRVDLTGIFDAHAFVPFASDLNDGGTLARDATGRVNVTVTGDADPLFEGTNPNDPSMETGEYYLNLRHSPTDPFNVNATLFVFNSTVFTNSGYGVAWEPLDQVYGDPLNGSTDINQLTTIVDPLTGETRLIIADQQGVFTAVYTADGALDESGIGTDPAVTGSRNGNLQDEEMYYTAAQPSALAAQAAGALFYGSGIGMTDAQSPSDLLSTGNLTWTVVGTSYGDVQDVIETEDRGGTGIATDQTAGISAANPAGSPSLYEYDEPFLGGDTTNFFRVQNNGATTGLTANFPVAWPANNVLSQGNGVSQLGNFTVNPINGSEALIGSNQGNVFETTNKGTQWLLIGSGQVIGSTPADFDGTYAGALAYGAPDPGAPNGIGNLDNFIYVGTVGGHIYVTRTGAGPWTNLSAGLDTSSVMAIYTDPNRGTHDAYAVTLDGVYYMADSTAANATWVNITGNLTQIERDTFGDPTLAQGALEGYNGTQLGGFRAIVADYRYFVPNPVNPSVMYPVLYVSGYGGVFRSLDNGQTWTLFPDTSSDAAPVDGGYLPDVDVTDLELNLGAINPATGHPTQTANQSATSSTLVPLNPTGTVSSTLNLTASVPIASGTVTVTLTNTSTIGQNVGDLTIILTGPDGQTFTLPTSSIVATSLNSATFQLPASFLAQNLSGAYTLSVSDNTAGDSGHLSSFTVTLDDFSDEVLLASTLGRGDYAIRLAPIVFGADVHLDTTLPAPTGSNTGLALGFPNVTSVATPYIDGLSESSGFGNTVTITLIDESNGDILGTGTTDAFGNFSIQIVNNGTDPSFFRNSTQFNDKVVGIQASDSSGETGNVVTFAYTLVSTGPSSPGQPQLQAAYNSGLPGDAGSSPITNLSIPPQPGPGGSLTVVAPVFNVPITLPPANPLVTTVVELLRSTTDAPGSFTVVATVAGGVNPAVLTDASLPALLATLGPVDMNFYYEAVQVDQADNVSQASPVLTVTVDTLIPPTLAAPTLDPSTNSGPPGPPYTTAFTNPIFDVANAQAGDKLYLYRSVNGQAPVLVGTAPAAASGVSTVTDTTVGLIDGIYTYYVAQQNPASTYSDLSPGVQVTINTQVPPTHLTLEPAYDTGRSSTDLITDIAIPPPSPALPPGTVPSPNFVAPVFDVTTVTPPPTQPPTVTVELLRSTTGQPGSFTEVNSAPYSPSNLTSLSDPSLVAIAMSGQVDAIYYYQAIQLDAAGIQSEPSSQILPVTLDTVVPPTLPAPALVGATSGPPYVTSNTSLNFSVPAGSLGSAHGASDQLFLYRSGNSSPLTLVGVAAIGATQVSDSTPNLPDNIYTYYVAQQDLAGNIGALSPGVQVTVNTQKPPTKVTLVSTYDTGRSSSDDITNIEIPAPTPGSAPHFVSPIYTVTTVSPPAGEPGIMTVELLRSTSPTGPFTVIASAPYSSTNQTSITDPGLVALAMAQAAANAGPTDYYYEADQISTVGITSAPSPVLTVLLQTNIPPALAAPTLDPGSNSGLVPSLDITNVTHPTFDVAGLLPGDNLELFRSVPGTSPTRYNLVGINPTPGAATVTDTTGVPNTTANQPNQVYLYRVAEVYVAGNISPFGPSPDVQVTINTTTPVAPSIGLLDSDDSGLLTTPIHRNVTNVTTPRLLGLAQFNVNPVNFPVDILYGEAGFSTAAVALPSGPTAANPNAVIFSPSTPVVVPAGQQVVAGFVTLTISNKSASGTGNLGNLYVELLGPGGQAYFLLAPSSTFAATSQTSVNYNLPASFLSGVLSGTYTLAVANPTAGDTGILSSWAVTLLNGTNGSPTVLASTEPAATNTYETQIPFKLADGGYIFVARSRNAAGTPSYSPPLPIAIKTTPPPAPTLALSPASVTGSVGNGVTANHKPVFTGTAQPGAQVNIYALINGQLVPDGTVTASTINGSFSVQLSNNLTDGTTTIYAQAVDIANNKGALSAGTPIRIITVAGDYLGVGAAQPTIFDPNTETYYVSTGNTFVALPADPTSSYRDIPVQYDINGDGITDAVAYRYNTDEYFGTVSPNTPYDLVYGGGGVSLPTSGTYGAGGIYTLSNFGPAGAYYSVNYPKPFAAQFVVPNLDVPVPGAYNGNGVDEIAVFRPSAVAGALGTAASDADSFSVAGPSGYYQVSFTSPAVAKLGFVYQPGDIPAPADYDGVGHDEFAVYRPSTGQFFILNTPNTYNSATWTLRAVTLNLPGGANAGDVPVSEDYDGSGKADPAVYRPSNSTFYILHNNGSQQTLPFGAGNLDVAAAGPLLYRLTALDKPGQAAVTDGYTPGLAGLPRAATPTTTTHAIVSAASTGTTPIPTVVAVAAPLVVSQPATATAPTPTPKTVAVSPSAASATSSGLSVVIGAATPTVFIPTVVPTTTAPVVAIPTAKPKATTKATVVASQAAPKLQATPLDAQPKAKSPAPALKKVVSAKKG